jgi:hypothetical protein
MYYNILNNMILQKKIEEFLETKDVIKFSEWVNKNVDENYLDPPIKWVEVEDNSKN